MTDSTVRQQLVIFDFDWSLVDQDTDRWVFEVLAPHLRRKFEDLEETVQLTDLVAQLLVELHALGVTRQDIEGAMHILPFHPAMVRAVERLKAAPSAQTTFVILSNSNSAYISAILQHRKLTHLFQEVITNPATWEPSGLLSVRRRIDPAGPQHNCSVGCSPNMCKGEELQALLARCPDEFDRVVYVGDGGNDFCPILRLRSQDIALARKSFGLEKRIAKEGAKAGLRCSVQYWSGAWEVEEMFTKL
ncbi:phosphatase phospho-type [Gautieria morchelliformis]|nr:phosphatase phospho-type [Gautieria morchelliformis]